jgi:protein-tyrosine phosphatase
VLRREPCFQEAAPDLYVGRWPRPSELPEGCRLVVDLTTEFPEARAITRDRPYLSLPILNRHVPSAEAMLSVLRALADFEGPVYVHCGAGRGRTAMLAAALLVLRGHCPDLDAAEALLRQRRPGVHIHPVQRRLIDRVCPLVRPATTAQTPAAYDRSQCA